MFVLTTVTRDCKNGDLYVSVDDNAYLTKEAASTALRARYEDFLKSMKLEDNGASDENGNAKNWFGSAMTSLASLSDKVTKKDVLEVFVALNQNGRPIEEAVLNHAKKLLDDIR